MDNASQFIQQSSVTMKQKIAELILQALETLKADGLLSQENSPNITVERSRDAQHGDFASNVALMLAKPAKLNPRQLAEKIIAALPENAMVTKVELAGPGFINFFIDPT
jgi:arginyl-tRNA synthetase